MSVTHKNKEVYLNSSLIRSVQHFDRIDGICLTDPLCFWIYDYVIIYLSSFLKMEYTYQSVNDICMHMVGKGNLELSLSYCKVTE